jgi:asparagine synthase (glutamine-hydrolysing)
LEARTPFLDKQFVSVVRSIHPSFLRPVKGEQVEKFILRCAFDDGTTLPPEVLWRRKEAFSDGVSKKSRSLYEIIQEYVSDMGNLPIFYAIHYDHNNPDTKEKQYYRYLYESYYRGTAKVVPYFWMPKWINATDASARTLDIYED